MRREQFSIKFVTLFFALIILDFRYFVHMASEVAIRHAKGVLLKGLPFSATEEEVQKFFKSIEIPDENIRLIKFRDGKGSGLGFVKLRDEEEIERALLMDKNHIGSRYVEVVPSDESELYYLALQARSGVVSPSDLYKMSSSNRHRSVRDRSPIVKRLDTQFAYIFGIPQGNNYKEVRKFFKGCAIAKNGVHLIRGSGREFRGDAYIEFLSHRECEKGLKMDGKMLDGSVIRVDPCTQEEVDEALSLGVDRRRGGRERGERTPSPVRRRMEVYTATYGGEVESEDHFRHFMSHREPDPLFFPQDLYSFSRHVEHSDYPRSTSYHHTSGPYAGVGGYPHLQTERPYSTPAASGGYGRNGAYGSRSGGYDSRGAGYDSRGGGYSGRGPVQDSHSSTYGGHTSGYDIGEDSRKGYDTRTTSSYPEDMRMLLAPTAQSSSLGAPTRERKVVRMEGLPYTISIQDILTFFRMYGLEYECVRIQCRDDGSPSGKAFVTFPSEKAALLAIHEMNNKYLGGRMVELFLV